MKCNVVCVCAPQPTRTNQVTAIINSALDAFARWQPHTDVLEADEGMYDDFVVVKPARARPVEKGRDVPASPQLEQHQPSTSPSTTTAAAAAGDGNSLNAHKVLRARKWAEQETGERTIRVSGTTAPGQKKKKVPSTKPAGGSLARGSYDEVCPRLVFMRRFVAWAWAWAWAWV